MKITVKIIGPFTVSAGFSEREIEVPEGTTPDGLLERLRLANPKPRIVTRNGLAIAGDEPIRAGDRIVIAPIYSGG